MLSLFHQNEISSSAALTTTSLSCMPFPQCSQAFEVSSSNSHIPRPSVTFRSPRNCKPSESVTQAFPSQDPLQLSMPSGITSLQSFQDKLSLFKFPFNSPCPQSSQASIFYYKALRVGENQLFFANMFSQITDEDTCKTWATPSHASENFWDFKPIFLVHQVS